MKRNGLAARAIQGVDAAEYGTTEELLRAHDVEMHEPAPPPEERSYVGVTLAVKRALDRMSADSEADWVVLFEDDAVLLPAFHASLTRATCEYADLDLVWLDTRNAVNWYFLRRLDGGSNAIMYRRAALPRVSALLDFNDPGMAAARKRFKGFLAHGIDVSLARLCNSPGGLRCASLPLVVESGAPKTTVMPKSFAAPP
jgi:hypothetical protein